MKPVLANWSKAILATGHSLVHHTQYHTTVHMSRRPVDILRPGPIESRGNSSDDSEDNDPSFGWNPSGSRQISSASAASGASSTALSTGFSGIVFTDGGSGDDKGGHLTRAAVLNEAGRRYDKKTKDLIEKTMEVIFHNSSHSV